MANPIDVRYPNITVKLYARSGRPCAVMGVVAKAMREANVPREEIDLYFKQATSGDYDHLLETTMRWINVR